MYYQLVIVLNFCHKYDYQDSTIPIRNIMIVSNFCHKYDY